MAVHALHAAIGSIGRDSLNRHAVSSVASNHIRIATLV
jgi:hypothetical protein